jgi:hypothetical protein
VRPPPLSQLELRAAAIGNEASGDRELQRSFDEHIEPPQGLSPSAIAALSVVDIRRAAGEEARLCSICLEELEHGDRVFRLD